MKLFVVSDIHGHYTLLRQALDAAGFDGNSENHLLVCCGDLFDRGRENRKVYDYICGLPRKVLIKGNHDERLAEIITRRRADVFDMRHGTGLTLEEFFGPYAVDTYGMLCVPPGDETAEELLRFIGTMVDYYETEHYVFTHGFLPLQPGINISVVREDWRQATAEDWHHARFLEWQILYNTQARVPGKTIVCGHRPTTFAHFFDAKRGMRESSIFYGNGVIAIDAGTVRTGKVNVLVVEETI